MNLCAKCASLWEHNPKAVKSIVQPAHCDYCKHVKQSEVHYVSLPKKDIRDYHNYH